MAKYGSANNNSTLKNDSADNSNNRKSTLSNSYLAPNSKLKVNQKDLLVFFRQLSVMLQSGVPLAQGLELLSENMINKKFAACIFDISRRLSGGQELSSCLRIYPRIFAPITIGLIEAGEAGGILSKVLERIALLLEANAKLKGQITGALVYPLVVLVLAVTISLALLIFIVPTFKELFDGLGAELPGLTAFMLLLSNIVTSTGFLVGAPITIFIVIYFIKTIYSNKSGREVIDRLILKVPLFGDLILRSEIASMSDTLSTLVNSGVPLVESLERCLSASGNEIIKIAIKKSVTMIQQGQSLSYALSLSKVMPRLMFSMIRIGEETGELSFMLENLSDFYKREVEETVSALTKAMEPLVIFVVAIIVGTIVVALYLPMFDLINKMG
ncbi:type II secretion system F family protein [Prochlorococcus marinus]|uniref:Type II secretory pathway, component PulF n=1 Tax=Prochlorococcus marinus (strain MIT 9211) TaxID=93059 RepID=A9BA91_PROM4|nr:type II secretion system F family protein [Prochlorococcus marinus]ABX08753.1 Type II secretory pathway, component PulF [Prochlorococcus marinus str. MIT 9211]